MILINPSRIPKSARRLQRILHREGIPHFLVCESESHFMKAVKAFASSEHRHLLIHGGDGTIHRALNVLFPELICVLHTLEKSIGFLRGGSGNGYHDSYRVPLFMKRQLRVYAESMMRGNVLDVDLLKIKQGTGVWYGQLFGIGFDVDVLKRRSARKGALAGTQMPKPGLLNYTLATLASISRLDLSQGPAGPAYSLELHDGSVPKGERTGTKQQRTLKLYTHALLIEIGKRPFYGNKFKVCPGTQCDDGLIEVYLFNFVKKHSVFFTIVPLWMGWHRWINKTVRVNGRGPIEQYSVKGLIISYTNPFDFHVDGELMTSSWEGFEEYAVHISIIPGAASFIVPKGFYKRKTTRPGTLNNTKNGSGCPFRCANP